MYLQQMLDLPTTNPTLYREFIEHGYHTIRRSDRYWAGLWSDLVIEQFMMRAVKSRGGLTRGRGFSESVRHQWVHTAHECASVHDAMTMLSKLQLTSSEQHVEMGPTRISRDIGDAQIVYEWLKSHNPFSGEDQRLRSISTGVIADETSFINCDETEKIGQQIHEKLDGVPLSEAKIKRKDQIKSLDSIIVIRNN